MKAGFALPVLLAVLIVPINAGGDDNAPQSYSPDRKEFYLAGSALALIRPGLNIEIQKAEIAGDTARVIFRLSDDQKVALDRQGINTPGVVTLNFVLARIKQGERQYTAYTTRLEPNPDTGKLYLQAARDSGGSYIQGDNGTYTYTFGTKIPSSDFDPNVTHTVGIYATRDLKDLGLKVYVANAVFDWVPAGGPVTTVRDVVRTDNCNSTCHDPLAAHGGGARREIRLCVLCHTPQTTDAVSGMTVDMNVMIHKIHRGADLPSVAAGGKYYVEDEDFSTVGFPRDIRNCEVCHQKGTQSTNSLTWPTRAACGSCHDDVDFATGKHHGLGGVQTSDDTCTVCHPPDSGRAFDISVKGGHMIPERFPGLPGVKVDIVSVTGTAPGNNPTVGFTLTDNQGNPLDPSKMDRLRLTLGGPTTDFNFHAREDARQAVPVPGGYSYRFQTAIPAGAKGTFVVAAEAFRNLKLSKVNGSSVTARDAAANKMLYFAVTDKTPVKRRTVVAVARCNTCHEKLGAHDLARNNVDYCPVCHRPNFTDEETRPKDQMPGESLDFKRVIHKLHSGSQLENDFTLFDDGEPENFNAVRFPGDRRNCSKCHEGTSYQLPLPKNLPATLTPRAFFSPAPPAASACLACHDSISAAAHAFVNIAPFGEACATCHGEDAEFAVTKMHAR